MVGLKGFLKQIFTKNQQEENIQNSSYSTVPFTLALRKRKYEEEQFSKYGIHKEKKCDID